MNSMVGQVKGWRAEGGGELGTMSEETWFKSRGYDGPLGRRAAASAPGHKTMAKAFHSWPVHRHSVSKCNL